MRTLLCLVALTALLALPALAGPGDVHIDGADVAYVTLDEPMEIGGHTLTSAYLVRLHGAIPRGTANVLRLSIGDTAIEEYGDFPGGVYFFVGTRPALNSMEGKAIVFTDHLGKKENAGLTLSLPENLEKNAMELKEALERAKD